MFNKSSLFPKSDTKAQEPVSGTRAGVVTGRGVNTALTGSADSAASDRQADSSAKTEGAVTTSSSAAGIGGHGGFGSSVSGGSSVLGSHLGGKVNAAQQQANDNRLIVGPNVKLKGAEILDCDTLIIEGYVEATVDSRVMRIAETGVFSGNVNIDVAEIYGQFDGDLVARVQLIVHSSGKINGKVRYGKIHIEEGGQIAGEVRSIDSNAAGTVGGKSV